MEETVSAEQAAAAKARAAGGVAQPGTMKLLFTQHWKPLLICIGVTLGGTIAFYTYTNFPLSFMQNTSGIPKETRPSSASGHCSSSCCCSRSTASFRTASAAPLLLWFRITGVLLTWPLLSGWPAPRIRSPRSC